MFLRVPGLFLVSAMWACCASAQRCGSDAAGAISTDRPQVTNSSVVVPCGSLQFENGFQVTGSSGQRGYDLPETAVRLGVLKKTELRLGVPEFFHTPNAGGGFSNGAGDMSVGFKQQLGPVRGFDVSVIGAVSLPTGADGISSHGYDAAVQAPWSRTLSKNWTTAGMLSMLWPTVSGRHDATGQASVYLDRQLTAKVDAYAEYAGAFPQRGGPQHSVDFGTAFKPTPHQQIDVHGGVGLSAAAPDYTVGAGYSMRFQLVHIRK